jgi:uncharacterized membrane protein YkvA (DUF1232 family)
MKKRASLTLEQATARAQSYVRHKEKLLWLLGRASCKSEQCYEFLLAPWESLQIFIRLLRAQFASKYCAPSDSILMIVASIVYFVSPFDLIPDSIPVLGFIDDAAVIACVARANVTLISNFRKWEMLCDRDLSPAMKCRANGE